MPQKNRQGTGKHPHSSGSHENDSGNAEHSASGVNAKGGSSPKSREYRDKEGNVHHHTRSYEDQHKR
jgi:hypothetical protein